MASQTRQEGETRVINKKRATILVIILAVMAVAALTIVFTGMGGSAEARARQAPQIRPAVLGQAMPDFTLPALQGGEATLSKLKGKNVLIVFSRGYAAEDYWCTICNYKYAELVELEKARGIRKTFNTEILFVFPYDEGTVEAWVEALPGQLAKIKDTKDPADPASLDEAGKRRMERWRQLFPKDFAMTEGNVPLPFPVLIDADRTVSKGLGLFATEWSGSKVDQNIPSVFIVDKNGVLKFKYVGQSTVDRPDYAYLFTILEMVNAGKL
jgi:peroxiredoxin